MRKNITISNEINKLIEKEAKKQAITQSQVFEIIARYYFTTKNLKMEVINNDKQVSTSSIRQF